MECAECESLQHRYESLTFAMARTRSELAIVEKLYDADAVERLKAEAQRIAAEQSQAREAVARHQETFHRSGKLSLAASTE